MIKDIKKIGLKDYILWKTLVNIEMIFNIPYFILKIIVEIFYYILQKHYKDVTVILHFN